MKGTKHTGTVLPVILLTALILHIHPAEKGYARDVPVEREQAPTLFRLGDSLYRMQRWEEAISYYGAAEKEYLAAGDTTQAWQCRYYRIMGFSNLGETDSASLYLDEAAAVFSRVGSIRSINTGLLFLQGYLAYKSGDYEKSVSRFSELSRNYPDTRYRIPAQRYLAYCYFQLGEFILARDHMSGVLTRESNDSAHPARIASDMHWMAILYTYFLGDPGSGLRYLNRARELYEKAGAPPETFSKLYNELGTVSVKEGDYLQAEEYYSMALNTLPGKKAYASVRAGIYNNLGIINNKMNRYAEAESWFLKSIATKQNIGTKDIYSSYNNMAGMYFSQGKNKEAGYYYRKAIENLIRQYGRQNWRLADSYQNYGRFLIMTGSLEKGRDYSSRALNIYRHQYGEQHPKTARCYLNFEAYFSQKEMYDSVLYYIQQSMTANSRDFYPANIFSNPGPEKVLSKETLLMSLKDKAWALERYYDLTADILYLKEALNTQEEAVGLVGMIRKSFSGPRSRALLAAHEEETYQNAFLLAVKLYRVTGNRDYLDKAFRFSEENRASGLLAALRTTRAIYFAGIPEAVIRAESDLTTETGAYRELLYKEQNKPSPDERKIRRYEERIFRLDSQKDSLVHVMEKKYPAYYRLKYDLSTIAAEDAASRLGKDQAILEYEIINGRIYIFCLTDGKIHFITRRADSGLDDHIAILLKELQQRKFNDKANTNYFDITYSSYILYQNLIGPADSLIRNKRLIIVPGDKISGIPFDILIGHIPHTNLPSYRKLPFLIYDHPVTYSYSSTLYFENPPRRRKLFNRVIAFAPDYPAGGMDLDQIMQVRQTSSNLRIFPLPFAREEARAVCRETRGRLVEGREASERFFKTRTARYDIIHLAMHTLPDNRHPLYSKLIFTQPPDSGEDGFLNTYEIYALRFKTNLAVLSACNSGSGRLSKGEGIISLARSFMYAGVSRLVMTLWEINDRAGAGIMARFYENLVHGMTVDEALQKAKISYLENAGPLKAHPYFWAGYQVMGNASALYYPPAPIIVLAALLLSGIILVTLLLLKKRFHDRR